ncbi:MAG: alpha/beta hydrolase, partial [Caldilineaceae bacterium]
VTALINTPALLLAGTHDPITPPAWARRAAASIEGSQVVLVPGRGHAVLTAADPCVATLLARFYAAPTTYTLPACLSDLRIEWAGIEQP